MRESYYFDKDTKLPEFLPYPKYLLNMDITQTARELYALLLSRATLSRKNNWVDLEGHVYLNFTIENCAIALGKCETTIKKAMKELDEANLLERKAVGFGKPNRLYVKIFCERQDSEQMEDDIFTVMGEENNTMNRQNSDSHRDTELPTNNNTYTNIYKEMNRVNSDKKAYGRYKNIFLSDQEYHTLQIEYGKKIERYIDEMSCNMEAKGIDYKNFEAALHNWAERDKQWNKNTSKQLISERDYSFKEGESL